MSRRRLKSVFHLVDLHSLLPGKLRAPLVVVMGSPDAVVDFLAADEALKATCWHMDVFEAGRLARDAEEFAVSPHIVTSADLWDVDERAQTIVYAAARGRERHLKLDIVEQAFHLLRPGGDLIVVAPHAGDQFFRPALKKIFGKVHIPESGAGQVLWAQRRSDRPRRRHETTFHVQQDGGPSLRFVSRPGVFAYGRFDLGARALTEAMDIETGDAIMDLGCGCGTNGVIAGLRGGPESEVVFVDSNKRALVLAEINARANGVERFRTIASSRGEGIERERFDVVLANPPYFGRGEIAGAFFETTCKCLRRAGRLYLVTKRPNELAEMASRFFAEVVCTFRRGYAVLRASRRQPDV